jgi:uncharacterized protein (TIGR03437 family)
MRTACLALALAALATAADFHTGQAARAVIGQSSFSSRETGVSAYAFSLAKGRLYAAESTRLLTFDITKQCALCGFAPIAITNQSVIAGISGFAVSGKVVVVADSVNHRVLVYSTTPSTNAVGQKHPEVAIAVSEPVSVAYDGHRLFVGDASQHRVLIWNALPNSNDQPADAVLGQNDGALGAATIGMPSALASDGTNLFVADTENRRILVFSPGDIGLAEDAIINSASLLSTPLAPGTLITIRAPSLVQEDDTADPAPNMPLPTKLAGVEVFLNGAPLPLLSATSEQIDAQLPYDLGSAMAGSLYVRSVRDNGSVLVSTAAAVRFAPASPGIFAVGTSEPRSGLLLHISGDQDLEGGPTKGIPITSESPASPGEVVTVWATGLGAVGAGDAHSVVAGAPSELLDSDTVVPIKALINGEPAAVLLARLPRGAIGVYDVAVVLPAQLQVGDEVRLQLVQNNVVSNIVTFPVKAPQ